jgi:hypothetical protein
LQNHMRGRILPSSNVHLAANVCKTTPHLASMPDGGSGKARPILGPSLYHSLLAARAAIGLPTATDLDLLNQPDFMCIPLGNPP